MIYSNVACRVLSPALFAAADDQGTLDRLIYSLTTMKTLTIINLGLVLFHSRVGKEEPAGMETSDFLPNRIRRMMSGIGN